MVLNIQDHNCVVRQVNKSASSSALGKQEARLEASIFKCQVDDDTLSFRWRGNANRGSLSLDRTRTLKPRLS